MTARTVIALLVLQAVERFIVLHRINCPETIYQVDDVIEGACEFIEELCDIAGYLDCNEDEC